MVNKYFILIYIVIVLLIGYWSSRKQSGADFMLANRKLGLFDFVGTTVASMVGGGFLVAYTAYIYEFGIAALFAVFGYGLGFALFGLGAKKLRFMAHQYNFHTLADYFHFKFDKKTGHLIAIVIFIIFILFVLNQFIAGTQILSAVSGYNYEISLLISALVVLIYLALGGFQSVVKTDIFQYLILIFLILVLGFHMTFKAHVPLIEFTKTTASLSLVTSFIIYGFLIVWHSADVWQRVYAAKNDKVIQHGMPLIGLLLIIIGIGLTLIAYSARIAFPGIDPAQAFVYGLTNLLSPGMLTLGIILVFATIMSSADTIIFILASNIAKDGIGHFKEKRLTANELRHYTRIALIVIVLLATILSYFFRSVINVTLINAGLGMSITPAIIGSFIWKLKPYAIILSIIFGVTSTFGWIIGGKILPETMVSAIFISGITLFVFQKILKK